MLSNTQQTVARALEELSDWIEANGPAGSDPYDALNSPLARLVTPLGRFGRIAFLQAVRRSPVDLRGLLRIPPSINAKGMAVLAQAHLELLEAHGTLRHAERARRALDWLERNAVTWGSGIGWGYPFDWAARAFFIPRDTPSVVVSCVAGQAFLRAAKLLGQPRYGDVARRVASFVVRELQRYETEDGICFSYTPLDRTRVLNASLMGAALLARLGDVDPAWAEASRRATGFVLHRQNPDGSWYYGLAAHHRWIDGHHTGFILRDLAGIADAGGGDGLDEAIDRGLAFYLQHLIAPGGRPLFRIDRPWPVDIHACAEAILVLTDPLLFPRVEHATERAVEVAGWTFEHLKRPDGAYGYRRHRRRVDRTAHLRWGQAWMLWALARLTRRLASSPGPGGVQ